MILSCLYIRRTASKGWGVFTRNAIPKDTVLEESPVVVMSAKEKKSLDETLLYNYIFDWEGEQCCMALGYISVYNHACPSNCEYFQNYEEGVIYIKAVQDILPEEELTINYNGDSDNKKRVWFELK